MCFSFSVAFCNPGKNKRMRGSGDRGSTPALPTDEGGKGGCGVEKKIEKNSIVDVADPKIEEIAESSTK